MFNAGLEGQSRKADVTFPPPDGGGGFAANFSPQRRRERTFTPFVRTARNTHFVLTCLSPSLASLHSARQPPRQRGQRVCSDFAISAQPETVWQTSRPRAGTESRPYFGFYSFFIFCTAESQMSPFLPLTGAVAEAPPAAEKARRGRRSGQNLPARKARQILGTARGPEVARAQRVTEGENLHAVRKNGA